MAIQEATAGLIGAAIGAGGALFAQLMAQSSNGKREDRRFAWEREQAAEARAAAQSQKFAERRLEAFSQILEGAGRAENEMRAGKDEPGLPRRVFDQWRDASGQTMETVRILAPSVYLKTHAIGSALTDLFVSLERSQAGIAPYMTESDVDANLRNANDELRSAMRVALGIEGEEWITLNFVDGDRE